MKLDGPKLSILVLTIIAAAALFGWVRFSRVADQPDDTKSADAPRAVPVEVTAIQQGPLELQRAFSGELEALAEFVVAPKISGRVERMLADIADTIQRGQVVAEMDDDEYVQIVAQSQADLVVAQANLSEARSALENANREFKRTESLLGRGIASDSDFDASRQEMLVRQAQLKVAQAQLEKARSSLESANIRLAYTQVSAGWTGGDDSRIVAERYVDEGQTVAANTPLLLIVELNPIVGIVYVTERDYARLKPGQPVTLTTDAYPDEVFTGNIARIAPIFRKSTRQARIEMTIENAQYRLKPGMFISAKVVLAQVPDATIVPEQALTQRNDQTGIFIVAEDGRSVAWRPVEVGVRDRDRVQVRGTGLSGRVVTLGQQLVNDGSPVTIPDERDADSAGSGKAEAP
ncbi:MAG: efflux RND transporter periplasmic adaptor subunit [Desulfobacterales bacterium]|jgi:RND family efflux transporter MFP subunit